MVKLQFKYLKTDDSALQKSDNELSIHLDNFPKHNYHQYSTESK